MIKVFGDRTEMIFGSGDIGLNSVVEIYSNDNKIGIIIFYNQEPRTIGSPGDINADTKINIDDFPVVMKFDKIESVDTLIEVLTVVKNDMSKNILIKGENAI